MEKINIKGIEKINDTVTLIQLKEDINKAIDKRMEQVRLAEFANKLSQKSFGYLKECFESMSPNLFNSKDGKKILSKYSTLIKENKNLKSLHSIYENIRKTNKNSDLNYFFEHFTSQNWGLNNKTLNEDVKKLGNIVAEGYLYETYLGNEVELPQEDAIFNHAVEYIVENKMTGNNLSKFSSAIKILKEHVEKNEEISHFSNDSLNGKIDNMVKEFNEKYSDLDESEREIVNEITKSESPEKVFEIYKEKCKSKIEEKKENFKNDENSLKRIDTIIEQISKKVYSQETLVEDINNMIEISNIFDE